MQKKRKYKPKNQQNVKKNNIEKELRVWLFFTVIYIFFIMYLFGMAKVYYPDPIHLGLGQYIDLGAGVIYGGIAIYSTIMVIMFKKLL